MTASPCQCLSAAGKAEVEAEVEAEDDNETGTVPELTTVEGLKNAEMHATNAWRKGCDAYLSVHRAVISATFARTCAEATEASSAGADVKITRPTWPADIIGGPTTLISGWQAQKSLDFHGITSHYIRVARGETFTLSPCQCPSAVGKTVERLKVMEMQATKAWREEGETYLTAKRAAGSATFARECAERFEAISGSAEVAIMRPTWPSDSFNASDLRMTGWQAQKVLNSYDIVSHYVREVYDETFTLSPCL